MTQTWWLSLKRRGRGQTGCSPVFRDSAWGAHDFNLSFVVFDLAAMAVESRGRVPQAQRYLPQSADCVYLLRDGRIEVLGSLW
jgi:hypothetical protein